MNPSERQQATSSKGTCFIDRSAPSAIFASDGMPRAAGRVSMIENLLTGSTVGPSLRMVTAMDSAVPHPSAECSQTFDRRRMLQLAGCLGFAATVGACAKPGPDASASPQAPTSPNSPQPPSPAVSPESVPTVDASAPSEVSPPTPALVAASGIMLCRDSWRAQPALPDGRTHTITRMTIHHTAAVLGDNRSAPSRLRQHQQYHQGERGWIDIAYHVGVDRNGNIYELRDWTLAGDTATDYDPAGHFLVLCEGDFDQELVSDLQLQSAALAFAWATQTFRIGSDTLGSHRDFASTACPGANLYARVTSGELRGLIDEYAAGGPVALQKVCGPEAAAMVANIEAGI